MGDHDHHHHHDHDDEETLPSALDNFIKQFFGVVTKIVAPDGNVTWSLPCNLDTGIPGNPRLPGEGVACYFFRLFNDGLVGITGPQGIPGPVGPAGTGENSYSTTAVDFTIPAIAGSVNVILVNAGWVGLGVTLFISGSGFYQVLGKVGNTLTLVFLADTTGATGTLAAGAEVQAGGRRGATGVTGNKTIMVFQRSAFAPATPTGNGVPAGWTLAPPAGFDALWMSIATQSGANALIGAWSAPIEISDAVTNTTAADIGSSGEDVYQERVGDELRFRRLAAGSGIAIDLISGGDPATDSVLRISATSVPSTEIDFEAYSDYGGGSPQVLDGTPTALNVAGVAQTVILTAPGRYLLQAVVNVKWGNGSSSGLTAVLLKFSRANNTPADLDNQAAYLTLDVATSSNEAHEVPLLALYTTLNSDDQIDIMASYQGTGADVGGNILVDHAHFTAVKIADA